MSLTNTKRRKIVGQLKVMQEDGITTDELERLASSFQVPSETVENIADHMGIRSLILPVTKPKGRKARTTAKQRQLVENLHGFKMLGFYANDDTKVITTYGHLKRYHAVMMDWIADERDGLI